MPFFVAFGIAATLFAVCWLVMPMPYPYFFVAGAYLGWLCYGILHHVEHVADLRSGRIGACAGITSLTTGRCRRTSVSRQRRGIGCSAPTSVGAVGSPGGDRYGVGR